MKKTGFKRIIFVLVVFFGTFICFGHRCSIAGTSVAGGKAGSLTWMADPCGNVEVVPTPSTGSTNDMVSVGIFISNNQCEICTFGFDLHFETSMFSYQGIEKTGCLTSSWGTVAGNLISPGRVRVGGFAGSASCIQASENGCLVVIKLKVVCQCGVCSDGQQSPISIDSYIDGMAEFQPQPAQGVFTLRCCCGDISLPIDKTGSWGDIINFPINIANNSSSICDFEFDFSFDPSVLEIKDVVSTSATQNWTTGSWQHVTSGKIRVSGSAGSGTCIPSQSSVSVAVIKAMVKCAGYAQDTSAPISIDNYKDGISCMCPRMFETAFLYKKCPQLGDVNDSSGISPADAQLCFDIYLGKVVPTSLQLTASDANCGCSCDELEQKIENNCITPADAQLIFDHYLAKIVLPQCCAEYQCPGSPSVSQTDDIYSSHAKRVVYVPPSIGHSGEQVRIPVMVSDPEGIQGFSLEMIYPQELLEYIGTQASPLTQGFAYVSGTEASPGSVNVCGAGEERITAQGTGSLAVVVFRVRDGVDGSGTIMLYNMDGDIFDAEAIQGSFVRGNPFTGGERILTLGEGRKKAGVLAIPVKVSDAFGIKAFGIEVEYPTESMVFTGISPSHLTSEFIALEGNVVENGIVRIGGFSMSGILENGDGILLNLEFQMIGSPGDVRIVRVVDDLTQYIIR